MRINSRTHVYAVLLAAVALSVSCGDDGGNPASPSPEEIVLATNVGAGSVQGPNEPAQPYSIIVNLGVAEEFSPTFETPEPLLFDNHVFRSGSSSFTAGPFNTRNFRLVADRMTDGVDGTAHVEVDHFGGSASSTGHESSIFDYDPGLTLTGADLAGYTVTGIRFDVNFTVTPNGSLWLLEYDFTVTVLGH